MNNFKGIMFKFIVNLESSQSRQAYISCHGELFTR
jgi:hypothetical protein